MQSGTQRYRILDAADGLLEEGTVRVADLIERQPWLGPDDLEVPVQIDFSSDRRFTPPAPPARRAQPTPAAPRARPHRPQSEPSARGPGPSRSPR